MALKTYNVFYWCWVQLCENLRRTFVKNLIGLFIYCVWVLMFVCILLWTTKCLLLCLKKSRGQFFSLSVLNWKQPDNRFFPHISIHMIYHQESKRNKVSVRGETNKTTNITWMPHISIGCLTSCWKEILGGLMPKKKSNKLIPISYSLHPNTFFP